MFNLKGKVAIVTGASSGIGIQYAKALSREGVNVAIIARRYDKLKEIAKEVEACGSKCLPIKCDISNEEDVKAAIDAVVKEFGTLDILVNNAGVCLENPAEDYPTEDWDKTMAINVKGPFMLSREAAKKVMIPNGYGRIINTVSMYGHVANTRAKEISYHASKAALINLTRAFAAEWATKGITVNAIGPGFFETEMTADAWNDENFKNFVEFRCPMKRMGKPGELNGALIYLASDEASFTTGNILFVDGGWTAV